MSNPINMKDQIKYYSKLLEDYSEDMEFYKEKHDDEYTFSHYGDDVEEKYYEYEKLVNLVDGFIGVLKRLEVQ